MKPLVTYCGRVLEPDRCVVLGIGGLGRVHAAPATVSWWRDDPRSCRKGVVAGEVAIGGAGAVSAAHTRAANPDGDGTDMRFSLRSRTPKVTRGAARCCTGTVPCDEAVEDRPRGDSVERRRAGGREALAHPVGEVVDDRDGAFDALGGSDQVWLSRAEISERTV